MEMHIKLVFLVAGISLLVACSPTEAWYKQVAGPSYYSVGRASGLLSGIRRSPYVRRAELDQSHSEESASNSVLTDFNLQNSILKTMPICIKDITPNLQSCELLQDIKGSFRCKADIFISVDSSEYDRD